MVFSQALKCNLATKSIGICIEWEWTEIQSLVRFKRISFWIGCLFGQWFDSLTTFEVPFIFSLLSPCLRWPSYFIVQILPSLSSHSICLVLLTESFSIFKLIFSNLTDVERKAAELIFFSSHKRDREHYRASSL